MSSNDIPSAEKPGPLGPCDEEGCERDATVLIEQPRGVDDWTLCAEHAAAVERRAKEASHG